MDFGARGFAHGIGQAGIEARSIAGSLPVDVRLPRVVALDARIAGLAEIGFKPRAELIALCDVARIGREIAHLVGV